MTATLLTGFGPVSDENAEILILGSMPGEESLSANQYYANRRNAFWKIMAELLGFDSECAYDDRLQALINSRIALWDVIRSCQRLGSLDTNIENKSVVVNEFKDFFLTHQRLRAVFFNGTKAESTFRKYVFPSVGETRLSFRRLPSTSPAHASLSYEQKLTTWRAAFIDQSDRIR